jgi:hypothetical protein
MELESPIERVYIDDGDNARYWDTVKYNGHGHPEQDLMLALLKDALRNYRKHLRNPKKSLDEDRRWFFSNDRDGLFSFESVCAVLGLNAQRIRKHLRAWDRAATDSAVNSQ